MEQDIQEWWFKYQRYNLMRNENARSAERKPEDI